MPVRVLRCAAADGPLAGAAIVLAATDDRSRGLIVPTATPGLTAHTIGHKPSLRASLPSAL
ncbi:hypothetical protein KC221_25865, partial [Mycobacterium tuberculosis]|nr:hypothetical protein [Mycobacterium tuberculosis]